MVTAQTTAMERITDGVVRDGKKIELTSVEELVAGDTTDYSCKGEYGRGVYLGRIGGNYAFTSRDPRKRSFILGNEVRLVKPSQTIHAKHISCFSNCSITDTEYLATELILKRAGQ